MNDQMSISHFVTANTPSPIDLASTDLELRKELAAALEKMAELDRQLKEQRRVTIHDPLTGAYNRDFFESEFEIIHAESERGLGYAMIILDLDDFSTVNAAHGQTAGDETLKTIGKILKTGRRREDRIIRWDNGDEFIIILPRCKRLEDASAIAEKVRQNIESCEHEYAGHKFKITASFGVAYAPPLDYAESVQTDLRERAMMLFKNADDALYTAKGQAAQEFPISIGTEKLGGNTVAVWQPNKRRAIPVHRHDASIQPACPFNAAKTDHKSAILKR